MKNLELNTFWRRPVSLLKFAKEKQFQQIKFKGKLKTLKSFLPKELAIKIWDETKKGNSVNRFYFIDNSAFEITKYTCYLFSDFKITFKK